MTYRKISILGAGTPFMPSLIYAATENKEALAGSEFCLMDIDPKSLPKLVKLGEVLAERVNADFKFSFTNDAKEALEDSDFILPSYRIGGREHMLYDIKIPTKHGIAGDETTGPGGTFMAQCTIPTTLEYCKMIKDLCPDAWIISYVNPASLVADAVWRKTNLKYIPVCDCVAANIMLFLPRILEKPPLNRKRTISDDYEPRSIGLNHFTWLVDLQLDGIDGYSLLKEKLIKKMKTGETFKIVAQFPWMPLDFGLGFKFLELYDVWSTSSSHITPYWEHERTLKERSREPLWEDTIFGWTEKRWNFLEEILSGKNYEEYPEEYCFNPFHARQAIGVLSSIAADEQKEWGGILFRNNGIISNLPEDAVVEGHAIVDKKGINPINIGDLPKPFIGISRQVIEWQELSVDAALTGDKDILYQAILACPYVIDTIPAKKIMDELLVAHSEFMPQFK